MYSTTAGGSLRKHYKYKIYIPVQFTADSFRCLETVRGRQPNYPRLVEVLVQEHRLKLPHVPTAGARS